MKTTFSEISIPGSGALAVFCFNGKVLAPTAEKIDAACDGAITRAMNAGRFSGEKGQILEILAPAGLELDRLVVSGLGKSEDADQLAWREAGGALAAHLNKSGAKAVSAAIDQIEDGALSATDAAAQLAFGARLRNYRFDRYLTAEADDKKPTLTEIEVLVEGAAQAREAFEPLDKVVDGVFLTRDLVSEPGNKVYPETFAEIAGGLSELGVEVEIFDEEKLESLGMNALLAVGQGSDRESRVVVMHWNGLEDDTDQAPVVFVGKGVTFDSGGISLKPGAGMAEMKWDMGGAGSVVGLMKALAGRKARVNAIGVIGLVENMPSGKAQRPGDIVTAMSGKTVEVLNTDAEGRLVLADVLWYAQQRFQPKAMIDLATLTGAIIIALGHDNAGIFSNDDELAEAFFAAGEKSGEGVWRFPLSKAYDKLIDSSIADMQNIGPGRQAGSITAAQFLQRFVGDVPWVHVDIAGMAWSKKDTATTPKGGTGFGVLLLNELVATNYEQA
ncbi:MAG: leucyl aminopeptidase [Sphingomonadales bacterium]